ncbi:hypothetical protein Tco_0886866 [Tanacetum coccineum]
MPFPMPYPEVDFDFVLTSLNAQTLSSRSGNCRLSSVFNPFAPLALVFRALFKSVLGFVWFSFDFCPLVNTWFDSVIDGFNLTSMGLPSHLCRKNLPKKDETVTLIDEEADEVYIIRCKGYEEGENDEALEA